MNKKEDKSIIKRKKKKILKIKLILIFTKIDNAINNFQFNVAIAQFYEVYKLIYDSLKKEINNKILKIIYKNYEINDTFYPSSCI